MIYYTTDGSIPTTASTVYHSAITVTNSTTLNSLAVAPGYTNSAVATATYTFNPYLGTNAYNTLGDDYSNAINATYAVTGNNAHGYTVTSCNFYRPTGTVTWGAKIDCGVVLAPTPTTQSSSWLCHGTCTNPSSHGAGAWVAVSGCLAAELDPPAPRIGSLPIAMTRTRRFLMGSTTVAAPVMEARRRLEPEHMDIATSSLLIGQYPGMGTSMLAGGNE